MAFVSKNPYQKLKPETGFDEDERDRVIIKRSRNWNKFRKFSIRKRLRLKVPTLRRLWRKKAKLMSAMRISCGNVIKRFKEGQAHFGDLFAGNYLFTQVNPTSLKYLEKCHYINGLSSKFSLPKIA